MLDQRLIVIPDHIRKLAADSVGAFFEPIARVPREITAADILSIETRRRSAEILKRRTPIAGRKLLDVGCGFGLDLAVLIGEYGADGYGIEPAAEGFDSSVDAARSLFAANEIEQERIIEAPGEQIPFPDGSFDIVYSSNAMEHTADPAQVLAESVRVLRPGGTLHMEIPNFMSYWEGHYIVPMPPVLARWMLPAWVRLLGRDPAYAYTLQPLNPGWCRQQVRRLQQRYPIHLVSLGEDLFLERLTRPFEFNGERQAALRGIVAGVQRLNVGNWIGRTFVALRGFHPIYLTIRKARYPRQ